MGAGKEWYLAVDIGGTAVKIGLVDNEGNFGDVSEYCVNFDNYETPILETVVNSCGSFLQECNMDPRQLRGIGVGATGYINTITGTVEGGSGFIRNWIGSRIKERLEEVFPIPVYVLNDANAAALGEVWLGAASGCRNVVALTIGTGVGGGIITDSRLLLGKSGFAGEIGHIVVQQGGKPCPCGNRGCLEQYASMTALVKQVRQAAVEGRVRACGTGSWERKPDDEEADAADPKKEEGISLEEINGRWIFQQIEMGNPEVEQIVDQWMDYIAAGIVSLSYIFHPEMIVIGGGVSAQKTLFIDKVREKVLDKLNPQFGKDLEIRAATLANRSGMAGAVYYCMQRLAGKSGKEA